MHQQGTYSSQHEVKKTTIRAEKSRKIIRKAENDLPQARVKSINSFLGYNAKQRDLSRSKLAFIISNTSMKKIQELIDKVSGFRHSKVKQRQINKFNVLVEKGRKYTLVSSQCTQASASPRQLGLVHPRQFAVSPWQLGVVLPRQAVTPPGC